MANNMSNIMHKILAQGLLALREQAIFPRLVNGDYSMDAAEKGDTIDVPIPSSQAAYDISPSAYLSATNSAPTKVQIQLDNWKGSNFFMSDKDMAEVMANEHFVPGQMSEAVRVLANAVNTSLHDKYLGVYGFNGTAGTTPFATTVGGATGSRKVLNQQKALRTDRRAILDYDAEANALGLSQFSDADKVMSAEVKIEGEIGRKFGIDWTSDDNVKTHTAGTLQSVGGVVGTTTAIDATTLPVKSAGAVGNIVIGDIFTIAGNSQTYVAGATVSAIVSGTAQSISIDPPLVAIASATAAVTIKATHVVNLVFHRDAFAFANRSLMSGTLASDIVTMTDPQTGITMRLEIKRQNKRDVWELDILWGAQLVRPALATRLAG